MLSAVRRRPENRSVSLGVKIVSVYGGQVCIMGVREGRTVENVIILLFTVFIGKLIIILLEVVYMQNSIHNIIDLMRSDPKGVSEKFGIPLRTVYGWCNGLRTPPEYVLDMMQRIIELEGGIAHGKDTDRLGSKIQSNCCGEPEAGQTS